MFFVRNRCVGGENTRITLASQWDRAVACAFADFAFKEAEIDLSFMNVPNLEDAAQDRLRCYCCYNKYNRDNENH